MLMRFFRADILLNDTSPCCFVWLELAEKGAYDRRAIYSPDDMRGLVAYAHERGVRIMIEFDVPGHGSWGKGMPELMGCEVVLDPTQNSTYTFLRDFLSEMADIFTDEYMFLGGDEVQTSCWDANKRIASWLKVHHLEGAG